MLKNLTHAVATILCACLLLTSCGPNGGQNKTAQNEIDKALSAQIAGSFVAAVKHNVSILAWSLLPSNLQDGAIREPNPHVQAVSCGGAYVLVYVRAGHEAHLQLNSLSNLKALRISAAVRQLWPQSVVGLNTSDVDTIMGTKGMSACAGQLAEAKASQSLGQGPVIIIPLSAVTDTLADFDPTRDVYSYVPIDANNPCEQKLQACHLDSTTKDLVCRDATVPQNDMPLTKNNCVQATAAVTVPQNLDITLWEQAVAQGIISTADAYTISGNTVTKLTTAMAQKLDCPENADATGIVENPAVTRKTGWTDDGSGRAPVSNPNTVVPCNGGWQGTLLAKYERRSCNLKKITSTGKGAASTQTSKPQTVFQLYYVAAKCQTATPVVNTATCSPTIANSNGTGSFSIARHFAMTQPVALTWTNSKNKSSSKLASDANPPPKNLGYTQLSQTVDDSGRGFSANLGNALLAASVLQKTTFCNIGTACDLITPNPPVTADFICPNGWDGPDADNKCTFDNITPGTCPAGSTAITIGGIDYCEMQKVCVGGDPNNNCKGQCPDGSPGPLCTDPKVCKTGDRTSVDGTTCYRDAVCPDQQEPDANGNCPAGAGSTGTIDCPDGTNRITVGGVITGCEKTVDCEKDVIVEEPVLERHISIYVEQSLGRATATIPTKVCVFDNNRSQQVPNKTCSGFDNRSQQPNCSGRVDDKKITCIRGTAWGESNAVGSETTLIEALQDLKSKLPASVRSNITVISGVPDMANNFNAMEALSIFPSGDVYVLLTSTTNSRTDSTFDCDSTDQLFTSDVTGEFVDYCKTFGITQSDRALVQAIVNKFADKQYIFYSKWSQLPLVRSPALKSIGDEYEMLNDIIGAIDQLL